MGSMLTSRLQKSSQTPRKLGEKSWMYRYDPYQSSFQFPAKSLHRTAVYMHRIRVTSGKVSGKVNAKVSGKVRAEVRKLVAEGHNDLNI